MKWLLLAYIKRLCSSDSVSMGGISTLAGGGGTVLKRWTEAAAARIDCRHYQFAQSPLCLHFTIYLCA